MTALTPDDLARIEELAEKATPGPWNAGGYSDYPGDEGSAITAGAEGTMEERGIAYAVEYSWTTPESCKADAEFIAAARTAVPALVAGVRSRDERIAELEAARDARVKAEALDLAADQAVVGRNGDLIAAWLRARAAEYREQATQ